LEQKARGQEDVERRAWKQMKEQQQGDTKALIAHQKKQLKQHRDRLKQVGESETTSLKENTSVGGRGWKRVSPSLGKRRNCRRRPLKIE
jgi:hypothetical protein